MIRVDRIACGAWVLASLTAFSAPVQAAEPDLSALLACRSLDNADARLACFDRETQSIVDRHSAGLPSSAPPLSPEKSFGLPPLAVVEAQAAHLKQPAQLETLDGKVVSLALGENGRVIITLDNGQIWRQLVGGEDLMLRLGDTIHLSRGIVGSYFMKVPSGRSCKVTRLR